MKLIIAIVQDKDANRLLEALVADGFKATKLASTGGFLRSGNTTLMIGTEEEAVERAIAKIREICRSRRQLMTPLAPVGGAVDPFIPEPIEIEVGGATIFVVDVQHFERV